MLDTNMLAKNLLNTAIFSLLGLLILCLSFVIIDRFTPYHLWKEINDKQNVALAIIVGALLLGISLIISASLHG